MPTRVTADWMAQQWRDGKRVKKKIGSYPSMSLAQAREIFNRDFAEVIQKGRSIKIATDTRPGTVADLFGGYVAALKSAGKPSWKETEKGLNKIANTLGRNRLAREIEAEEIVELIRPIYERGARSMADHVEVLCPRRLQLGHEIRARLSQLIATPVPHSVQSGIGDPDRAEGTRHALARRGRIRPVSIGGSTAQTSRFTPPTLVPSRLSC
jgi:hypothetical protein